MIDRAHDSRRRPALRARTTEAPARRHGVPRRRARPRRSPAPGPRRAAVSSFGFGGTNCHLVLEQAPPAPRLGARGRGRRMHRPPEAFVISAPTPELLDGSPRARSRAAIADAAPLADLACSLATRTALRRAGRLRRGHASRAPRASSMRHATCGARARGRQPALWFAAAPLAADERTIAMLFPGQGAQALDPGAPLYDRFTGVPRALRRARGRARRSCSRARSFVSLSAARRGFDEAAATASSPRPRSASRRWRRSASRSPASPKSSASIAEVFTGHSLGEFVALAAGGALSARDAVRFVARRGRSWPRSARRSRRDGRLPASVRLSRSTWRVTPAESWSRTSTSRVRP